MNIPDREEAAFGVPADSGKNLDARQRILLAASSLFAERGFEGVSTTQIARQAGITQPLIHYHFKNKEALWKCTVAHLFGQLRDTLERLELRTQRLDGLERFETLIAGYVEFVSCHPELGQFVLREGGQESVRLEWMLENWLSPLVQLFQRIHETGQDEGWMRPVSLSSFVTLMLSVPGQCFAMSPMMRHLLPGTDETEAGVDPQLTAEATRWIVSAVLATGAEVDVQHELEPA